MQYYRHLTDDELEKQLRADAYNPAVVSDLVRRVLDGTWGEARREAAEEVFGSRLEEKCMEIDDLNACIEDKVDKSAELETKVEELEARVRGLAKRRTRAQAAKIGELEGLIGSLDA